MAGATLTRPVRGSTITYPKLPQVSQMSPPTAPPPQEHNAFPTPSTNQHCGNYQRKKSTYQIVGEEEQGVLESDYFWEPIRRTL